TSNDPNKDSFAGTTLGHSRAKRQFAYEFGVDPYSPFPPLQKTLDDVAWAAVGGNLTVFGAMSAIPGVAGTVITTTKTAGAMKNVVRDKSPAELRKINEEKLGKMGVPGNLTEQFLNNPYYGSEEQTILIGELDTMGGVPGRDLLI